MPRWPEQEGLEVRRLAFADVGGGVFRAEFDGADWSSLAVDGIATWYEVLVNETPVLGDESMFAAYDVALDGLALRRQGNVVEIRCRPLDELLAAQPKRPRQRWRTKVVDNGGALRFVRTSVIGRAPGFAPGPEIVGPWRPVWLVRRALGSVWVDDVALRPRVEGDDGVLAISAWVGPDEAPPPARVEAVVGTARATLAVAADGRVRGEVRVPGVQRWWPHTHGVPVLHDVALVIDGERIGLGRTGFRALSPGPGFDADRDALALAVNGVGVFARGAVWTPVAEDEVRPTLETLRDAGCNMVRLPGIGVPETPEFHDLCDELGMLVWQDFTYANLDYPIADPGFRARAVAEARALLAQVAGRPSLAVLCGNSEVEQQAAMFGVDAALGRGELFGELLPGLAREAGADVPYVPSAPCGGALPFHPGTGVANYFGVGGYRRPLSDARTAGVRFAAECLALAHVPDGDDLDPAAGVMRDVGADWDFADVRDHYLRELYGVDPAALRATDRARYLALGRQVGGEVMAAVFGEWRRSASPCGGGLVLWSRDLAPGAGWGLLDHRGAPKVALAHLRRALAPRALWLVDEGLNGVDVHVANDGPEPLDAILHVALLADGTHAIAEASAPLRVDAHATVAHNVEGLLGRFADAAYAYRFGPPAHDAVIATLRTTDGELIAQSAHFPTGPPLQPTTFTLNAQLLSPDWGTVPQRGLMLSGGWGTVPQARMVELVSDRLAWGVRIAAPGFAPEDDAFVLVPGVVARVVLRPLHDGADWAGATVTALNLIGEAPVSEPDMAA
ncbi:MAG: glycoside hydrolase family 2 protein [Conexibacter sp.]|nr:glycoside hydrolase family 2 protein [Conexibacter sp.]